MAFHPVFHDPVDTLRFGRVLPVEIAPAPPAGRPCRYCEVLAPEAHLPTRTHFSVPDAAARVILSEIERGVSVDAVVFGGPGEPLRHGGLGSILRKIRTAAHVPTVVLTNGVLLGDRDTRRDAAEAGTVVVWLPGLRDRSVSPHARANAWERHVEGIASVRRETPAGIALEIPVCPGVNDGEESRRAWRRAAERTRPDRVFVIPDPRAEEDVPEALERVRRAIHPRAGAYLSDGTFVDVRCECRD